MFGLAQQIGRTQFAVHRIIGNHQRFGWTGEQVDPDLPEQLPLGLGDKRVARADDHIDRPYLAGPQRHGADRLHPAQAIDLVGARKVQRHDDCRVGRPIEWRRGRDDPFDAGHPSGNDAHVSGSHQRVLAARHIATDALHWNIAVAQHDARPGFHLHVGQRFPLNPGEVANLFLGKANIGDGLRVQASVAGVNLFAAQSEGIRRPAVELLRVAAHGIVSVLADIAEYRLHRLLDARVAFILPTGGNAPFQISNHVMPPAAPLREIETPLTAPGNFIKGSSADPSRPFGA